MKNLVMYWQRSKLILLLGLFTISAEGTGRAEDTSGVDFNRDIRPILSDNCFECHGPDAEQRQADLRLDTRDGLFRKTR
mgnify:CR=1 FL=1